MGTDNSGGCSWNKVFCQDGATVGEKIYGSNEWCSWQLRTNDEGLNITSFKKDFKNKAIFSTSVVPSLFCVTKGDSATTAHYWKDKDTHIFPDIQCKGPLVTLPNFKDIYATEQGNLPLSRKLSKTARIATLLPELRSSSHLSLGQLCDDDFDILLNKKKMYVIKEDELILQGTRNKLNGLWNIPVYKTKINDDNFKTSITNAALYIKQETIKLHATNKKIPTQFNSSIHQYLAHSMTSLKIWTK